MKDSIIIQLDGVSKCYKNKTVLDNCDLNLYNGKIYGFVGPNGAGKTTLFRTILNLTDISKGNIYYNNKTSFKNRDIRFGALIEEPYVNGKLTAYQNLKYIELLTGINNEKKIAEVLEIVGLHSVGKKKVKDFSLGMRQRLGIAMAIITEPDVLILDEPMNGLDPEGIIQIRNSLLELNKNKCMTMLISSHILGELDRLVTDYIFLKDGRILLSDSKSNITETMNKMGMDYIENYYMRVMKIHE